MQTQTQTQKSREIAPDLKYRTMDSLNKRLNTVIDELDSITTEELKCTPKELEMTKELAEESCVLANEFIHMIDDMKYLITITPVAAFTTGMLEGNLIRLSQLMAASANIPKEIFVTLDHSEESNRVIGTIKERVDQFYTDLEAMSIVDIEVTLYLNELKTIIDLGVKWLDKAETDLIRTVMTYFVIMFITGPKSVMNFTMQFTQRAMVEQMIDETLDRIETLAATEGAPRV